MKKQKFRNIGIQVNPPKEICEDDGIVHIWNLPEDRVFIKLSDKNQKIMVKKALRFFRNEDDLANHLHSNQGTINGFKNNRSRTTNLKLVKNLSQFLCSKNLLEYSLKKLEKNIKLIKTKSSSEAIVNPHFPINFNDKKGGQILSAFLFDGGLRKSLTPFYVNNEKILVEKLFGNLGKKVGKIYWKSYSRKKIRGTYFVDLPRILGLILNSLGISNGKRVFTNPTIPNFVLNGNDEIKQSFLQQAFDDEGTVKRNGNRIKLNQNNSKNESPVRLTQLKELLGNFELRVTGPFYETTIKNKSGYTSYRWGIEISNQLDIQNFAEKINFSLKRKRNALSNLLNSYNSVPMFKHGTVEYEVLKACRQLIEENKLITNKNIAMKLEKSESYSRQLTLRMVKNAKIKITRESIRLGGRKGSIAREFNFTKGEFI